MLDDVLGLIMVQIVSNLGSGEVSIVTIIRPVVVSIGMVLVLFLLCRYLVVPLVNSSNKWLSNQLSLQKRIKAMEKQLRLSLYCLILFGMVASTGYAGTSNLFGAYLAGVVVCWLDDLLPLPDASAQDIYNTLFHAAVSRLLKPFFFVGLLHSLSYRLKKLSASGIHWLRHPDFQDVPGIHHLERASLHRLHGTRQVCLRHLASPSTTHLDKANQEDPRDKSYLPTQPEHLQHTQSYPQFPTCLSNHHHHYHYHYHHYHS